MSRVLSLPSLLALAVLLTMSSPRAQAQGAEVLKFVAVEGMKAIGTKLIDGGIDRLWGKETSGDQRVAELSDRLSSYESGLRQVDAKAADQIAALRKDLNTRTTADDVRKIVNQTLASLEERTGKLENRQDTLDSRVRQLEDLFGYIPTVTPAPLLVSAEQPGKPAAHPLTLEWLTLLLRSEKSRYLIADLRRTRPDTSQVLRTALAEDQKILGETEVYHGKVMKELAGKYPERQALLAEFNPGTPEVRKFDESLSSVTWLAAVTRPVGTGPYAGRLAVPQALFGYDAPEIVKAFELAKADNAQIVELYRQYALTSAALKSFLGVDVRRDLFTPGMLTVADDIVKLAIEGIDLTTMIPILDARLKKTRTDFADGSAEVQTVRAEQLALLKQVRALHGKLSAQLGQACEVYVEAVKTERPTNRRLTAFRNGVLLPTAAWVALLETREAGFDSQTWLRLSGLSWGEPLKLQGHTSAVSGVAFSPDGKRIVTASLDKTARIWDAETGQELRKLEGHTGAVSGVAFSPDGKRIVTASLDKTARVWDAESGQELRQLEGHTNDVYGVAFSPDGKRIVTASFDKSARVWDAETGKELCQLQGHTNTVAGVAFSPDGQRIATASNDRTARVWDADSGKELRKLEGHTSAVWGVAFSPDGKRIATASVDRTARIWDAETGQELRKLEGHTRYVMGVAFSPDGKRIVTASNDKTARVWEADSGQQLRELEGHAGAVYGVAFSPDGKRIVTASADNTARVWDVSEAITRASAEAAKAK